MFLKSRNIISKMKRSKVTDYAALMLYLFLSRMIYVIVQCALCRATTCSPTQYAPFSSKLCTLHTLYAPLEHFVYPAYTICYQRSILCRVGTYVISVVVRGYTICSSRKHVSWYVCLFSNCPLDIHLSILRTLCLKPCPHHNCIIVVFNPHQQYVGDVVSKFGFLPDLKSTF